MKTVRPVSRRRRRRTGTVGSATVATAVGGILCTSLLLRSAGQFDMIFASAVEGSVDVLSASGESVSTSFDVGGTAGGVLSLFLDSSLGLFAAPSSLSRPATEHAAF